MLSYDLLQMGSHSKGWVVLKVLQKKRRTDSGSSLEAAIYFLISDDVILIIWCGLSVGS